MLDSLIQPQKLAQFGRGFEPVVNNEWTSGATTDPLTLMETIISSVIGIFTIVAGLFFIYQFIKGALDWINASGDSGKIQKARDAMVQGAIGLVIVVMAYAIVDLIGGFIGIDLLEPATALRALVP